MKKRIIAVATCIIGIAWLSVVMFYGINIFMGSDAWIGKLLIDNNIETNKKFTGGAAVTMANKPDYKVVIHEPVYAGVFIHSKEPFIQVDWLALSALPPLIEDTLDINSDGISDIKVIIDTQELSVKYEALRDDIKGLLDKGSLADVRAYVSKNSYDGLFYYHNKELGNTVYKEGVTIRIIFDHAID